MARWQLQTAKARLSELVRALQEAGPQEITLHGTVAAVVVSREEYERLAGGRPAFLEFVQGSPLHGLRSSSARRVPTAHASGVRR